MGITKSNKQKDLLDKFYTKKEVAKECVDFLQKHIDLKSYDLIIEPSAGNGSFSNLFKNCLAYDISPENDKIIKQDFLLLDKSFTKDKRVLIIGNPPFGQQAKEAFLFINECSTFAETIAFILPLSFKKKSYINRMPPYFICIGEKILDKNSYTFYEQEYSLPCVFQIWQKKNTKRKKYKIKTKTKYFNFTTKDKADFRIQRVGGNAGKASLDLNYADSSNYFIKNNTTIDTKELVEEINKIQYEELGWTCGPKSLSKGELIEKIEEKISVDFKGIM